MNKFPFNEEQKTYFEQVASSMGLKAEYVEKDFWVCWVLNKLYSNPTYMEHITFKGGTSLSKVWKIIDRFSEDIDLTISRDFLGYGGDNSPEKAPSKKQTSERLKGLRSACQQYVINNLMPSLTKDFTDSLPPNLIWSLSMDEEDNDRQTILFEYQSNWPVSGAGYVQPIVRMEFGARSDPWPAEKGCVKAFVAELYPDVFEFSEIKVLALNPQRTFLEKAMLLHEERFRPLVKARAKHLARHYYDLWCLSNCGVADEAINDKSLFEAIAEHREVFFKQSWVDYNTLKRSTLRLAPHPEHLDSWKKDYDAMKEMFLKKPPKFEEIIKVVENLQLKINSSSNSI